MLKSNRKENTNTTRYNVSTLKLDTENDKEKLFPQLLLMFLDYCYEIIIVNIP